MINYNKNKLINEALENYYNTFSHTLDTEDFVSEKFNKRICKYIFRNMRKHFKKIDKEDREYQRQFRKDVKAKRKEEKQKCKVKAEETPADSNKTC